MDTINTISNAKADRLNRKVLAEVKAGQIRLLYQHPFLIVINLLNAVLVIAVLWKGFPRGALLIWLALFLFVIPARFVVANLQVYRRCCSNRVPVGVPGTCRHRNIKPGL